MSKRKPSADAYSFRTTLKRSVRFLVGQGVEEFVESAVSFVSQTAGKILSSLNVIYDALETKRVSVPADDPVRPVGRRLLPYRGPSSSVRQEMVTRAARLPSQTETEAATAPARSTSSIRHRPISRPRMRHTPG